MILTTPCKTWKRSEEDLQDIFYLLTWCGQTKPSGFLINHLHSFNFGYKFAKIFNFKVILRKWRICNLVLHTQWIITVSVCVFIKYTYSFHVFSKYAQLKCVHSTYRGKVHRFTLRILRGCTGSSHILSGAQIIKLYRTKLVSSTALKGRLLQEKA